MLPCRFLSASGFGALSDAILCIDYAMSRGATILVNSFLATTPSTTFLDIIRQAKDEGVLIIAAAGNSGTDLDKFPGYPAAFDEDNILSVASCRAPLNQLEQPQANKRLLLGIPT